jgi:acetylornithine deacetylase/succinyl-diaminopimelate desuccinylase-like protein
VIYIEELAMTTAIETALAYAHQNQARFLDELKAFVSLPSISTDPAAVPAIHQTAEWVADQVRALGFQNVAVLPTAGHPVVYGESLAAGQGKPIVLIYGHYDVQPVEPLDLWESPPFEPEIRDENLFGRGASDMKGQVMASLKAVEALVKTGGLAVNVKFLIEGEEEIGSPNLEKFIVENKDLLACDFALNPDSGMIGPDSPTITYGLRGLAYFEIRLRGPAHDLHSGMFGGVVHNPAQVLCELIAGMHDAEGHITLPHYYDRVRSLTEAERAEFARLPMNDHFFLHHTGVPHLHGEAGFTSVERVGARPTLEVNGLYSGFIGEGSKTVLPSTAMAKISMRLVPDQNPDEVYEQLRQYLEINAPKTVNWEVIQIASGYPSLTDLKLPAVNALSQAMQAAWGKPAVYKREGGSVPVVAQMKQILGIESILAGFGLPDDNLHAPNEKFNLPNYYRGIDTFIHFLGILGETSRQT